MVPSQGCSSRTEAQPTGGATFSGRKVPTLPERVCVKAAAFGGALRVRNAYFVDGDEFAFRRQNAALRQKAQDVFQMDGFFRRGPLSVRTRLAG